jgi:hypothetical protein
MKLLVVCSTSFAEVLARLLPKTDNRDLPKSLKMRKLPIEKVDIDSFLKIINNHPFEICDSSSLFASYLWYIKARTGFAKNTRGHKQRL